MSKNIAHLRPRILWIEDNQASHPWLAELLTEAGANLATEKTFQTGVQRLKEEFHGYIVDVMLPYAPAGRRMDPDYKRNEGGLRLIRDIRGRYPNRPIIAFSAKDDLKSSLRGLNVVYIDKRDPDLKASWIANTILRTVRGNPPPDATIL